ncbi:prepilin-type N-terminal cleavage/methylation domain-containing protein [Propionivibrio sp.]|uniref:PilW family protein n=1 Tax=Propionivibrio sp. TaxID=2212460 RepID=UPI0025E80CD5|nr:prepilin-type N-terminal cleavage/methylation domain-containing protein [Propionivibrio sp.]
MSPDATLRHRYETGFSLIELMVGMTIGFIAMVVIVQALSVFEGHKRTTTAAADAQENGLLAMMAIEADIRKAGAGFNHPASFACRNFFSYYQDTSGAGAPVAVGSFMPVPVLIDDVGTTNDTIHVRSGLRFTGSVPTKLVKPMDTLTAAPDLLLEVERPYDFNGAPATATDPPADLIMVVGNDPDYINCSLMQVSSKAGSVLTIANGPAGKKPEYNATQTYMTANNWPGFGTGGAGFLTGSLVYRVGNTTAGGVQAPPIRSMPTIACKL